MRTFPSVVRDFPLLPQPVTHPCHLLILEEEKQAVCRGILTIILFNPYNDPIGRCYLHFTDDDTHSKEVEWHKSKYSESGWSSS